MIHLLFFGAVFLLDLLLMTLLPIDFSSMRFVFIPSTMFIFMIYCARTYSFKKSMLLALGLGFLYDLLLFQQMFELTLVYVTVMLVAKQWSNHLSESMFETITLALVTLFLKEWLLFVGLRLTQVTEWHFFDWMAYRVFPTLLLATLLSVFVYGWYTMYDQIMLDITSKIRRSEKLRWYQHK